MPMFVSAGSNRQQATSPWRARVRAPSRSLISTTRVVVRARATAGPMLPGARGAAVVADRCEGLVDGAVVAPVVDEDLRPAGDLPGQPDREPVGVRGRERELPVRQAEPAGELLGDHDRVLGREHERRPPAHLVGHGLGGGLGGVAGHRAGVAQAQVDVLVPVDVGEAGARRLGDEHGKRARPLDHPVHRHAGEQRSPGAFEELSRARMLAGEALVLAGLEPGQPRAVDGGPRHPRVALANHVPCILPDRRRWRCRGSRSPPVAKSGVRVLVTLACQDCKRRNYQTNKSKRNSPDRIEFSKYCRWCGHHTPHRETR